MIEIGQNFGNFFVKEEIGRGGMGTIYMAVDTMLNREVALKVIHPELATNEQLMERFKIEAMTQAQMNHPNVVIVFSFNKIDNDFVIAMEYVAGRSLKDILKERRVLSIKEAIHYFKQILGGLEYAHAHNIIHRDIKPANIMITKDDRVKISDFGIAKVFGKEGLTKTGMLLGTPWYTSPEQILGKKIDFRSDLYSGGITFYEMLTGRVPFNSETNSEFQIQRAHLETPPTRPSIYNSEIGTRIEKFILKTLQKDSDKRFQNAKEMSSELEKIEKNISETTIMEDGDFKSAGGQKRGVRKKKSFILAIASVLIVIAAGTAAFLYFKDKPNPLTDQPKVEAKAGISNDQSKEQAPEIKKEETPLNKEEDIQKVEGDLPDPQNTKAEKVKQKPKDIPTNIINKSEKKAAKSEPRLEIKKSGKPPQTEKTTQVNEKKETSDSKPLSKQDTKISGQKKDVVDKPVQMEIKKKPVELKPKQPAVNVEAELFRIKNLLQARSFKQAEALGEALLKKSDSAMVYSTLGSIKFFLSKFRECEQYWQKAIAGNGSVRIRFFHKHGVFNKGCSGQLVLKKGMILFDSSTRADHSFALTADEIIRVAKPKSSFGIDIQRMVGNIRKNDTFILYLKSKRRQREIFIADFINKYVLEGR